MKIRVLGSAAGGGFPQWNCGCTNCTGVRNGAIVATPRSQESLAVSADGDAWFLLNASPEIRQQIEGFPPLHPRDRRHSPIAGIVLTNGDLDHCLGLLSLRESHPLVVYATSVVREGFTSGNALYRTLERFPGQVTWRDLSAGVETAFAGGELTVTAWPVPGKLPLHLEQSRPPSPDDNVALLITERATGKRLAYVPAVGSPSQVLRRVVEGADVVFFDGTFWSSEELIAQRLGQRRAEDMAHWPVGGPEGSLRMLSALAAPRKILIHVNNTNPLLRDDSPERRTAGAAGVEVAFDGMELAL